MTQWNGLREKNYQESMDILMQMHFSMRGSFRRFSSLKPIHFSSNLFVISEWDENRGRPNVSYITGWWLGHPSEKYEVNWDD